MIVGLGLIAILLPAPFFVRNYVNTGVPDWPLHQDLFGAEQDYLYEVTTRYSKVLTGQRGLQQMGEAVMEIVTNPQFLPLMWPLAMVGGWCLWRRRDANSQLYLGLGLISFLGLWWLLQPRMYPRFITFALPQLMVMAALGLESLRGGRLWRVGYAGAALCAAFGMAFMFYYSLDFFRFQIDRDAQRYHRFTWYYDEYRWIDEHLAPDARVMVIVSNGHTYYLNRDYVRADPSFAGTIDWRDIDAQGLREAVRERGIRYILYENIDWHRYVGGDEMTKAIAELFQSQEVKLLWKRDVRLSTSRVMRIFKDSEVWLLDVFPEHPD